MADIEALIVRLAKTLLAAAALTAVHTIAAIEKAYRHDLPGRIDYRNEQET